jgi:hypothetical protein
MSEHLRPLKLGEILDRTAQLYRRNFLTFAGTAAAPTAITVVVIAGAGAAGAGLGRQVSPTNPLGLPVLLLILLLLIGIPLILGAAVVSQAALTRAAVGAHMGQPLKILAALKSVWPHFWRYLGVLILQGIVVAGIPCVIVVGLIALISGLGVFTSGSTVLVALIGFFTFVLFAAAVVYVVLSALRISMSLAVCVVEDKPAWGSVKRASSLSKGARGRIFVMFLLVWALSVALSMIGYIPTALIVGIAAAAGQGGRYAAIAVVVGEIVNILINFAMQTLIMPVYVTALVLFYYDQRVRMEGYDIEWMMEQAGLSGHEPAPANAQTAVIFEPSSTPDTLKEL